MYNDHMENCGCYDCKPYKGNHTDNIEDKTKASYYVDSTLVARKPVTVYSYPSTNAPIVKQYAKGSNIGIIYSYVLRDGVLWWQIDWFSKKPQGWVKHDAGLFDKKILEDTSSGQRIETELEDRNKAIANEDKIGKGLSDLTKGIGETISFAGGSLKWILIAVIIAGAVYLVMRFKK